MNKKIEKKIAYRINEIGEVFGGGTPSTQIKEYWGGNIPWISPDDLANYNKVFISNGKNSITELGLKKSSAKLLPKGTLLFSSRAPIGYVAIANNSICTNQGFKSIVLNDKVDNLYFYYWIKCNLDYLKMYGTGSTFPEISTSKMNRIKVEIFEDKKIQVSISKILNNYDSLIENNNHRIKLLETMAEELYKEWFVKFRFPKAKRETKHRIVSKGYVYGDNINGLNAPKSWDYKKLNSIGKFVRGRNVTQEEMQEENIEVISAGIEPSGFHNEYNVNGQSLTISASGANAGYLSYHLDNIWAADCSYYNGNYIWFIYHSSHFIKSVINNLQVGSAQPHVYAKNVNNLFIIVPDINAINEFENKVKNIYSEIKILKYKNNALIKQRDYLLPRLMSGKLSVENKNII